MSTPSKGEIIIKDACILFDLIDLELLASFYELDYIIVTTQSVLDEIVDEAQLNQVCSFIESGRLQIDQFGEFDALVQITETNPGLSFTDASVLEAASRRGGIMLSSDKGLRNESKRRGLQVRGLLWAIEEMLRQQIIDAESAIAKLNLYPHYNNRAPQKEITLLIDRLRA
jgi:predicted nucleic acid-binding protein